MTCHGLPIGLIAGFAAFSLQIAQAQVPPPPAGADALSDAYTAPSYSPYAGRNFPSRVLWGDTHLHTSFSMDAGAVGNRLLELHRPFRLRRKLNGQVLRKLHLRKLNRRATLSRCNQSNDNEM